MNSKFKDELNAALSKVIKQNAIIGDETNKVFDEFETLFNIQLKNSLTLLIEKLEYITKNDLDKGIKYYDSNVYNFLNTFTDKNLFSDEVEIAVMAKIANELNLVSNRIYRKYENDKFEAKYNKEKEQFFKEKKDSEFIDTK